MEDLNVNTETPTVETPANESVTVDTPVTPDASAVVTPVEPEFVPNYKYKAYGKELEVDEWARPLLNKDTQPHLIKLFEKAGGFEPLKESYQSLQQNFGQYKDAYSQLDGARNKILESISRNDLGSVFKILGVDNNQVREFVKQQLMYEGMSPEQKAEIDKRNQLEQSQYYAQEQLRQQQEFTQNLMLEKHEMEMSFAFHNPKYSPLIASYNEKMGDANAFRSVVDRIGAYEFNINGRNIPVNEAVETAIKMVGLQPVDATQAPQVANMNQSASQQSHAKPAPKPIVIANGSSPSSPVKKRPMSIADLQKEYETLTQQTN